INDFMTAAAMVAKGNYLALLPRHTAAPPADSGVVLRPLSGLRTVRHIDLLMRPEQHYRTAVSLVAERLKHIAEQLTIGTPE
ncbi:TPA: LysR substrate-binding domain-containing protein, partial [Streptococcus pneumoniae]